MSSFNDFIKQAVVTESVVNPADRPLNLKATLASLILLSASNEIADAMKKYFFYNRPVSIENIQAQLERIQNAVYTLNDRLGEVTETSGVFQGTELLPLDSRLFHTVIGISTESGEMVDAIIKAFEGLPIDMVNVMEELGDVFWYEAIGLDVTGLDGQAIRDKVIAKLRTRYKDKFDAFDANNRNLGAERQVLEA